MERTGTSDERLLQSLLLALLVHVILLLLMSSHFNEKNLPEPRQDATFASVMLAHVVHHPASVPETVARPKPEPLPKPQPVQPPPPPKPVHGAAGLVKPTVQPLRPKQKAQLHAEDKVGPRTPDRVPAIEKPKTGIARPHPPKPRIDQKQADAELQDIQQEAKQLNAEAQQAAEEAAINRMAAQVNSKQESKELDVYKLRIINAIRQHWIQPLCAQADMFVVLKLQLLPDGSVVSVQIIQPNSCLNLSVRNAIDEVDHLPVPQDIDLFEHYFRSLILRFRPLDHN